MFNTKRVRELERELKTLKGRFNELSGRVHMNHDVTMNVVGNVDVMSFELAELQCAVPKNEPMTLLEKFRASWQ